MAHCAAELFLGDFLMGDRLNDLRTGYKHVGSGLDHEHEVGDCRRVDSAAGTRAHDGRDLGHYARGEGVAKKNVGIAGERGDPLLDPRTTRVVEANNRRADLHREVHNLADLCCIGLRQ